MLVDGLSNAARAAAGTSGSNVQGQSAQSPTSSSGGGDGSSGSVGRGSSQRRTCRPADRAARKVIAGGVSVGRRQPGLACRTQHMDDRAQRRQLVVDVRDHEVPPGRSIRVNSASGSRCRSPGTKAALGTRSRARTSISGELSTPTTECPRTVKYETYRPVPHPAHCRSAARPGWRASPVHPSRTGCCVARRRSSTSRGTRSACRRGAPAPRRGRSALGHRGAGVPPPAVPRRTPGRSRRVTRAAAPCPPAEQVRLGMLVDHESDVSPRFRTARPILDATWPCWQPSLGVMVCAAPAA